ncbi:MAG TPA: ABC transporter substrate-binding protein [Polyangiaceae bacterium]
MGLPLFYLAGCAEESAEPGAKPDDSDPDPETVETPITLFSWWVAPGEADALDALIAVHNLEYPLEKVSNAAIASGDQARDVLEAQLKGGEPPDLFQENAYDMASFLRDNPGGLTPLTDLFEELGLFDVVVREVIADITLEGEIYSMPVNIHRENALHYSMRIFEEQGLEPPTTLEEFLEVCEALKAAGITPLASANRGWILRILFNALSAASMGVDAFRDYYSGASELDEPAMRAAIELLGKVLDEYVNASAAELEFDWTDAADLVLNGEAAMFIHGDWAKGYFTQQGWKPGEGFGVIAMPGTTGLFLYGVDAFALPTGSPHPEAALHFLRTVASKAGQLAFNELKGSSPIRLDTMVDDLDPAGRATLDDLRSAEVRLLTRSNDAWDAALAEYAISRDADALLAAYVDSPPGA